MQQQSEGRPTWDVSSFPLVPPCMADTTTRTHTEVNKLKLDTETARRKKAIFRRLVIATGVFPTRAGVLSAGSSPHETNS